MHVLLCIFTLTCAALDGPHGGGGGARRRAGPPDAHLHTTSGLLLFLRAAFLNGTHVAVATHAEAAGHGQVQRVHSLRLHLTEDGLAHRLDLAIHLHLAHLQTQGKQKRGYWKMLNSQPSEAANALFQFSHNLEQCAKNTLHWWISAHRCNEASLSFHSNPKKQLNYEIAENQIKWFLLGY